METYDTISKSISDIKNHYAKENDLTLEASYQSRRAHPQKDQQKKSSLMNQLNAAMDVQVNVKRMKVSRSSMMYWMQISQSISLTSTTLKGFLPNVVNQSQMSD